MDLKSPEVRLLQSGEIVEMTGDQVRDPGASSPTVHSELVEVSSVFMLPVRDAVIT